MCGIWPRDSVLAAISASSRALTLPAQILGAPSKSRQASLYVSKNDGASQVVDKSGILPPSRFPALGRILALRRLDLLAL